MEELDSIWNYKEDFDQIKQRLQLATIELESLKIGANEEKRKHSEEIVHLRSLIKLAYNERNEAREQLQMLINNLIPHPQSENPMLIATKANTSITESNSLSDAYNHHRTHCSSFPLDTFFDTVTSPDFSSKLMGSGNQPNVPMLAHIDSAAAVIDDFAKGTTLPQKGHLLHTVLESGPLLQTLIFAGPLPRWRNPPPLQSLQVPCYANTYIPELLVNQNKSVHHPFSAPMLSFASSEMLNTPVKRQKVSMS